eukprot:1571248-Alexandrium_andersonii.AAC.1
MKAAPRAPSRASGGRARRRARRASTRNSEGLGPTTSARLKMYSAANAAAEAPGTSSRRRAGQEL